MANEVIKDPAFQYKLKSALGLTYLTRARLDGFNANHYILKDIWKNTTKTSSQFHFLGYDDPELIPFYPESDSYRAATSGSKYNKELLVIGEKLIEYDFTEAYTNIMRNYKLPSNIYLANVKMDKEKLLERLSKYDAAQPYRNLSTFMFVEVYIEAFANENTYTTYGSHFAQYGKVIARSMTITEIELKMILDFYDVKALEVINCHTFRCRQGMLDDYFEKIDVLKEDEETLFFYKMLRNKIYGTIGKLKLNPQEANIFKFPMYNRAFSSMVSAVFRDRIARYEQKYVFSEYGLVLIKTDGLYFRKEVPEFERLYQKGIVKKKEHIINEEHLKG